MHGGAGRADTSTNGGEYMTTCCSGWHSHKTFSYPGSRQGCGHGHKMVVCAYALLIPIEEQPGVPCTHSHGDDRDSTVAATVLYTHPPPQTYAAPISTVVQLAPLCMFMSWCGARGKRQRTVSYHAGWSIDRWYCCAQAAGFSRPSLLGFHMCGHLGAGAEGTRGGFRSETVPAISGDWPRDSLFFL